MSKKKPKKPKKPRARTLRRIDERRLRKLAEDQLVLAQLEPGGRAERPLEVQSAAIVEARAESLGCPICQGPLRTLNHDAVTHDGVTLRRVRTRCTECETRREVWVRIVAPLPN